MPVVQRLVVGGERKDWRLEDPQDGGMMAGTSGSGVVHGVCDITPLQE